MRMTTRRPTLLAVGAASLVSLLCAAPSVHAQGLAGLYPGAPGGPPRQTLGASSGGSIPLGVVSPGVAARPTPPVFGGGIVSGPPMGPPFMNGYGGFPGGGFSPGFGQAYAGPRWNVRSYGEPRPEMGAMGGVNGMVAPAFPANVLPDSRVNPTPAPSSRPTLGAVGGTVAPPTEQFYNGGSGNNNGSATNNGGDGITYQPTTIYSSGPALLGGYYYGGYTDTYDASSTYPSVYGVYDGFPGYIDNIAPGVYILTPPQPLVYVDDPQPFYPPVYTATYNQNNYYVTDEDRANDIERGGTQAPAAVKKAYPADSYQAAFADIERSWNNGDISLLQKHLRSNDTKVSVFLKSAYKYSLNSSDFAQITRDAFDRLNTVSFKFTALQKAKNGDITAYGTHLYQPVNSAGDGAIVPFDADDADAYSSNGDTDGGGSGDGTDKTVYVSYTLRHGDAGWYITSINSSTRPLLRAAQ